MTKRTETPSKDARNGSSWYLWIPTLGLLSWLLFLLSQSSRPAVSEASLETVDHASEPVANGSLASLPIPASNQLSQVPEAMIADPNAQVAIAYLAPPPNSIPAVETSDDRRSLLAAPSLVAAPEAPRRVEVKMNAPKRLVLAVTPSQDSKSESKSESTSGTESLAAIEHDELDSLTFGTLESLPESSTSAQPIQIAFGSGTTPSRMSGIVGAIPPAAPQMETREEAEASDVVEIEGLKFEAPDEIPQGIPMPSLDPPSLVAKPASPLVAAPTLDAVDTVAPLQRLASREPVEAITAPTLATPAEPMESRAPTIVRMAPRVLGNESKPKLDMIARNDRALPPVEEIEPKAMRIEEVKAPSVEPVKPLQLIEKSIESTQPSSEPIQETTAKRSIRDQQETAGPVVSVVSSPVRETESTVRKLKDESAGVQFNAPSLQLAHRGGQTVSMPGIVRRVQIADEAICEAIRVGDQDLSLLGSKIGRTHITIWLEEASEGQPNPIQFEVEVQAPWQAATAVPTKNLKELQSSVNRMHRDTRIEIRSNADGSLTVVGSTHNEESAKQILNLIRKLCLVPIHDQVVVRTK